LRVSTLTLLVLLLCAASPLAARRAAARGAQPTTGTLDVDGGSIYYETLGAGPEAVVLIHGGYGDRRMWDGQFRALASRYRVVRYDHRGFGRSAAPRAAYSPVDDLIKLLDRLDIRRAHLVGNSLGGSLAIDFALLRPERVASLAVVASGPQGFPVPRADIDAVVKVFTSARTEGTERAAEMWLRHPMVAVSSRRPGARELLRRMVGDNRRVFLMEHWPSERLDPPAAKRLGEITAPTLVVIGGRDTELSRRMGEETARGIRGARKVLMREGDHLPQMVNPSEFNRHLLGFLRSLARRP
jgi:3-oxoadipate enol-lactonase